MDEKLAQAVAPLIRDIEATAGVPATIDEESWTPSSAQDPFAVLVLPDGGTGFSVDPYAPLRERIWQVADVVQQAVIEARAEAGLPSNWPRCPDHPTKHPLALNADPWPAWCCPWADEGVIVAPVGSLHVAQADAKAKGRRRPRR
jgi:hypothetical protein